MSGKTTSQGASLNQGACGVNNWMAVRPMYKSWQSRHATVRNSNYCGLARPGVYLKKIHFNLVHPLAAILKTPVWGLPASTARRCVALSNHINAGAPYSAIHVNILLKLMILCVGVPGSSDRGLTHIIITVCCLKVPRFVVITFWRIFQAYPSLHPCVYCSCNFAHFSPR